MTLEDIVDSSRNILVPSVRVYHARIDTFRFTSAAFGDSVGWLAEGIGGPSHVSLR